MAAESLEYSHLQNPAEDNVAPHSSGLSWNTSLSRTSVSSLSCAAFSAQQQRLAACGLDDVIRSVRQLRLRRYPYQGISREEALGQGETYLVERCTFQKELLAIKHLKMGMSAGRTAIQRRLNSVILEMQIMKHGPLLAHPNVVDILGYGWNTTTENIMPYILVEYAPYGNMRQYLMGMAHERLSAAIIESLAGDVAAGLSAIHKCGIIHGDVKLDNVLLFPSWDRKASAIAKLTDFGHALVVNAKSQERNDDPLSYDGTLIYNAPEVLDQKLYPIDRENLQKCDIWAFGLLLWEICIGGAEYLTKFNEDTSSISPDKFRKLAKASIPGRKQLGAAMFLEIALHRTLQDNPAQRAKSMEDIPLFTKLHATGLRGLKSDLALHLEDSSLTYEMFRLDTGKEILWVHEKQIFENLLQIYAEKENNDNGTLAWQLALCYYEGFGTARNEKTAYHYMHRAKADLHPLATAFTDILYAGSSVYLGSIKTTYTSQISVLLSQGAVVQGLPAIVRGLVDSDTSLVDRIIAEDEYPLLPTSAGFTILHCLPLLQGTALLSKAIPRLRMGFVRRLIDAPCSATLQVHSQWPLQLEGTAMSIAIAMNCIDTVKILLSLGASPLAPVYHSTRFAPGDLRLLWTPLHVATKYHNADILSLLLSHTEKKKWKVSNPPLGCALSFSTELERRALYGANASAALRNTISAICQVQRIDRAADNGMTPLMQAIDFRDHNVVEALLKSDPRLADTMFRSPSDGRCYNSPMHFAAQIASRLDTPDALVTLDLLYKYSELKNPLHVSNLDFYQRTPLHMAVTGSSGLAANWILNHEKALIHRVDKLNRTALHYCSTIASMELILSKGVQIDHRDKFGMTALHWTSYEGQFDLVQCLIEHGSNLEIPSSVYGTALHCAVINGSLDVTIALLNAGSNINSRDKQGNTPLHCAAKLDRYQISRILLKRGAKMEMRNKLGNNVQAIAIKRGYHGIVRTLRILDPDWDRNFHKSVMDLDLSQAESWENFNFSKMTVPQNQPPDFLWDDDVEQNIRRPDVDTVVYVEDTHPTTARVESFDDMDADMVKFEKWRNSIPTHGLGFGFDQYPLWLAVWMYFDDSFWGSSMRTDLIEIMQYSACHLMHLALQFKRDSSGLDHLIMANVNWVAECVAIVVNTERPPHILPGWTCTDITEFLAWKLRKLFKGREDSLCALAKELKPTHLDTFTAAERWDNYKRRQDAKSDSPRRILSSRNSSALFSIM